MYIIVIDIWFPHYIRPPQMVKHRIEIAIHHSLGQNVCIYWVQKYPTIKVWLL